MRKIKSGDEVIVIAGKDKGKVSKVKAVLTKEDKVIVEGVNLIKKHLKANPQKNMPGKIEEREIGIHVSNVAIFNVAKQKADRVKFKYVGDKKIRVYASSDEPIPEVK